MRRGLADEGQRDADSRSGGKQAGSATVARTTGYRQVECGSSNCNSDIEGLIGLTGSHHNLVFCQGPPKWMGNEIAKCCEIEYTYHKERFIQMKRKKWWVTTVDGWQTAPDRGWVMLERRRRGVDAAGRPVF